MELPGGAVVKDLLANAGSLGHEDSLEKKMVTHSSILAWQIPWTENLMGYSPWGSQKSWTRLSN